MRAVSQNLLSILRVAIITALLFIVFVTLLTWVPFGGKPAIQRLLPLQNPGGPSHSLTRFREAAASGPVDIVFLGASHAYRGFDPRIFQQSGFSSKNLGSSSQTPLNTVCLLRRHLKTLKPKLVVYEIYGPALGIDGMESYYDLLANTPVDGPMVQMAWNLGHPQVWTALLSTYLQNLRSPLARQEQRGKEGRDDLYVQGGFMQCTAVMPEDRLTALMTGRTAAQDVPVSASQLAFLGKSIELVRQSGARFVAVSYPIPTETRGLLTGYDEKQQKVASFFSRQEVAYRDFNDSMKLDTARHFYDEVHLNQAGVEIFNAELVRWLHDMKLLPAPSTPLSSLPKDRK